MVKKHWAHTNNYEDFVRFIGNDLNEKVLGEYLSLSDNHKNATYLSPNMVYNFLKVISEWILEKTLQEVWSSDHYTVLMDESTDDGNRSQLSLICRIVEKSTGTIENRFLDLLNLSRCDDETIFRRVESFLEDKKLDKTRRRFAGMDGCSTMSWEHYRVKTFEKITSHFTYIHCQNHCLALRFAHLTPQYAHFKKFDSLLLNLYLLLKNSSVKQVIFDKVEKAYELTSLKLIKAAETHWLSHGKAAQWVLDRYESLVTSLDAIYEWTSEPAVCRLRDDLINHKVVLSLYFLADVLNSTNVLQPILQGARLNFFENNQCSCKSYSNVTTEVWSSRRPKRSCFGRLQEIFDVAAQSVGARLTSRSHTPLLDLESFKEKTIRPFFRSLIYKMEEAFSIPEQLKDFTSIYPATFPKEAKDLTNFGEEGIIFFADFYSQKVKLNSVVIPSLLSKDTLPVQYKVFKTFVFKEKLKWENQQEAALANAKQLLTQEQNWKKLLKSISSKQKLIKIKKIIQKLEEKVAILGNQQDYIFDILLKSWMLSPFSDHHIILLGSLIPPLTAKVERSFSFMKLICTQLRNRLLTKNLSHCMRICKFRDLRVDEYEQILRLWIKAGETKNKKKRKVSLRLQWQIIHIYMFNFFIFCFYFFISSCLKRKRYLQWPHIMLCKEFTISFYPHNPFLQRKIFWHLNPYHGGGGSLASSETKPS